MLGVGLGNDNSAPESQRPPAQRSARDSIPGAIIEIRIARALFGSRNHDCGPNSKCVRRKNPAGSPS